MTTDAARLLDKLEGESRKVYLDAQDSGILRISGEPLGPEAVAEVRRLKPGLLAILKAEALAREADKLGGPFDAAGPEAPPWRMPDGSLMAHATMEAFRWMGEFLRAQREAGETPADRRAREKDQQQERAGEKQAGLIWDEGHASAG